MKNVNKKILIVWIFIRSISFLVICGIIVATFIGILSEEFKTEFTGFDFKLLFIICYSIPGGIISLLLLLNAVAFPFIQYKMYRYEITEDEIIIREGFILRRLNIIPISQIQDVTSYNGPVLSILKLKSIIISTGGSRDSIHGFEKEKAEEIVEYIREKMKSSDKEKIIELQNKDGE